MVTIEVHVALFELLSVTVRTTVFGPKLLQLKVVLLKARLTLPQTSELPLFTAAPLVETVPALFRLKLIFLHSAAGGVMSATVTTAVQVFELPLPSFTVKTTVLVPRFAQLNVLGNTETWFTVPQLSKPLWNTLAVEIEVVPPADKFAV